MISSKEKADEAKIEKEQSQQAKKLENQQKAAKKIANATIDLLKTPLVAFEHEFKTSKKAAEPYMNQTCQLLLDKARGMLSAAVVTLTSGAIDFELRDARAVQTDIIAKTRTS